MAPDYQAGAMENAGCVLYRDTYVRRDEKWTQLKREGVYNTILHEISHMWFGNLVTMKWWDDLWLNESFADMISFMCMDESPDCPDMVIPWVQFADECWWGLDEDQLDTTHPIATEVESTGVATDIFDGISYGKGAAWLHQLVFFFGKEVLKTGLRSYFAKYPYKNTELKDFIAEMSQAAKQLNLDEVDMEEWSAEWLKSAGCSEIGLSVEDVDGKITSANVIQTLYGPHEKNRLRTQKFQIALLDENMQVIEVVVAKTSSQDESTTVPDLIGKPLPTAFLLNYGGYGFAKFKFDDRSLRAFEENLHKVKVLDARKNVYNMLHDNVKSMQVAGSQALAVIKKSLPHE